MKIKEQDGQRMVLASPLREWLLAIIVLVLVIAFICLVGLLVVPELTARVGIEDSLIPTIVISVVLGLYSLGKIIGTKFVVDKLTQSVGIHERRFLFIHRQRVIPFRDITSVDIDYRKKWGVWGAQALVRRSAWQVSLNVAGEKLKIDHTTNKADMHNLVSEVSNFMGKELVDNSEMPGTSFERFFREEHEKPSAPEDNKEM